MNKRLSGLLTMSAMLFAGSAVATNANAVEAKTTLAMISQDNASHIDRVLGELRRQHDGIKFGKVSPSADFIGT